VRACLPLPSRLLFRCPSRESSNTTISASSLTPMLAPSPVFGTPKRGVHGADGCSLRGGGIANTSSNTSGRGPPVHPLCLDTQPLRPPSACAPPSKPRPAPSATVAPPWSTPLARRAMPGAPLLTLPLALSLSPLHRLLSLERLATGASTTIAAGRHACMCGALRSPGGDAPERRADVGRPARRGGC
jgi:hypothetical protein